MNVLVIDDDTSSMRLMAYLLRHAGHSVRTASDGEIGIQAMLEEVPQLVICDCQMPRRTGLEVAEFMRGHPALRDVPLVAVTAAAMPADRDRALAAGFDRYIVKPFDPSTIVAIIEGEFHAARPRQHQGP